MSFRFIPVLLLIGTVAIGHDGLDLAPPNSEQDAWNVIRLCSANIEKLIAEKQWSEIPIQASLSNQGARFLKEKSGEPALRQQWQDVENTGIFMVRSAMLKDGTGVTQHFGYYRQQLGALEPRYDPKIVQAPVFSCPMCRGIRELDSATPCFKCGMKLVPRFIPASSLYNTPGEPSIVVTPRFDRPLTVNQPSVITLKFTRKKDRAPITREDLLVVHTEPIHLLIVDQSLGDYHHEHPLPTAVPGEFTFSLNPRRPGPYRVFADLVPAASNVQEYAVCDLAAVTTEADPLKDRASTTSSTVDGIRYDLNWLTGGAPLRAQQPVNATITVTGPDGKPFTQLEPIMGAYAHLVAFHEDRQTVLHIHPVGVEPRTPEDRGGPIFTFRFYAPNPGYYRFYSQVQIGGAQRFAPFGLTVAP